MFVESGKSRYPNDDGVSDVVTRVREYLDAGSLSEASELVERALERYPDDLFLEGVRVAVSNARLNQANARKPPPNRRLPLFPLVSILAVVAAAAGIWIFAGGQSRPRAVASPPLVNRIPQPAQADDAESLRDAVRLAVRDHYWAEARTWLNLLATVKPGDPMIKELSGEIDSGSAGERKTEDLRSAAQAAVRERNWNEADTRIAALLKEVPGDPEALEWRKMLEDGRREDGSNRETAARNKRIAALRASIPVSIGAKRWDEAQRQISDLQLLAPDDPEAIAWQRALTVIRISGLTPPPPVTLPPPVTGQTQPADQPTIARPQDTPPEIKNTPPEVVKNTPPAPDRATPATLPEAPSPVSSLPRPERPGLPDAPAPVSESDSFKAHIKSIAGRWGYVDPAAPKPKKTDKGLVYSAELVRLTVNPDGTGQLLYSLKKGALDGTEGDVEFHFRATGWDGKRLSGESDTGSRNYAVALEPAGALLKLEWRLLNHQGALDRRRATNGTALLVKGTALKEP